MTMNMCIIMAMNIYIQPELEIKLRKEPSMSGLINHLLQVHYGHLPRESVVVTQVRKEIGPDPDLRPPKKPSKPKVDLDSIPGVKRASQPTGTASTGVQWTVYRDELEYEVLGVFGGDESLAYLAKGWKREIVK